MTTGLAIWGSQAITFAGALFLAWRHDRESKFYLIWAVGLTIAALAFALQALRGFIPDVISIVFGNGLLLVGQALWICGFSELDRKPIPRAIVLPLSIWLAGVFLPWVYDDLANRMALYYLANSVGTAMLVRAIDPLATGERAGRLPLAVVIATLSAYSFCVALAVALHHPTGDDALKVRAVVTFGHAVLHLAGVALCVRLLMVRSERRWRALSSTDVLTGVLNRRGLQERFTRIRQGTQDASLAALLFDLDHFKAINDRYGHQAGDTALSAFAHLAHRLIPRSGVFGRMGGEEFIALIPVGDQAEATAVAELIRANFCRAPVATERGPVPVTVSVGVAVAPIDAADWDRLISAADRALYAAKNAGRNRTVTFSDNANPPGDTDQQGSHAAEHEATLEEQIHALRRLGSLSRS